MKNTPQSTKKLVKDGMISVIMTKFVIGEEGRRHPPQQDSQPLPKTHSDTTCRRRTARQWVLTNLDGRQRSRQGATDDATTNHRQERWRGDDVGEGCSDGDSGGKGKGVAAAALAAAAVTGGRPPSCCHR